MHDDQQSDGCKQPGETPAVTEGVSDSAVSRTEDTEYWECDIKLKDVIYHISCDSAQRARLATLIPPKPKPQPGTEESVLRDHQRAVANVWQLLLNWCTEAVMTHDGQKLEEGEAHAERNPHHWPLDGYDTSDGMLPIPFFAEACCDYIATVFGRAFAGRGLSWMEPTNTLTAGEVLTATTLGLLQKYGLATISPELSLDSKEV